MTAIGFAGLGHMGLPMAQRLLKAGHTLYVYDVMPAPMQQLAAEGAIAVELPLDMMSHIDVLITMVQSGQQVKTLCLGAQGLFEHAKKDTLYIDCSSIDIVASREVHSEALRCQIAMLDAPVSGGVAGASAGTLTFMVGGEESTFNRAKPILEAMGKKIIHAGAGGSGQAAKICNNLLLGISMIGVSEAFSLAKKLGLDQQTFFDISSNASGQCWSMTSYCPVPGILENAPSNNQYRPGFMAKMMLKDLRLAQHAAESVNAAIPLGAEAAQLYELFVNHGEGETDFSGIIKLIGK